MPADFNAWFWWEPASAAQTPAPVLDAAELHAAFGVESVTWLGKGAFGETWRLAGGPWAADGPVAAKVIFGDNYPRERLDRETQGLARTSSRNVVRLLQTGVVTTGQGAMPVLVCEFVQGGDVATAIANGRWPTYEQVHAFAVGVLSGLVALHSTNTVHRDIKPENIALRGGDWSQPVILDLGLTKQLDVDTFTKYPSLLGTTPFMAPEQLRLEEARKGADLWALGVVLHILLNHTHPFYGPWAQRLELDEALARLEVGALDLPADLPEPLRSVATRLLEPVLNQRGSAPRALRDLTQAS